MDWQAAQFELNPVELLIGKASRRKDWLTVGIAILPNHHITTAQVFKVVGEGAERANDRVRVPARFVFDPLALDCSLAQEVVEIDG